MKKQQIGFFQDFYFEISNTWVFHEILIKNIGYLSRCYGKLSNERTVVIDKWNCNVLRKSFVGSNVTVVSFRDHVRSDCRLGENLSFQNLLEPWFNKAHIWKSDHFFLKKLNKKSRLFNKFFSLTNLKISYFDPRQRLDVNQATLEQFQTLPGITQVLKLQKLLSENENIKPNCQFFFIIFLN